MFKWQQGKHVLSIYLKQNDSREQCKQLLVATFGYLSNFSRATFGYIVKQLSLNLLAQCVHAYCMHAYVIGEK